jgi:hypothetical protein
MAAGAGPSGLAPSPVPGSCGSPPEPVGGRGAGLVVVDAAADTACGGWLAGSPECHGAPPAGALAAGAGSATATFGCDWSGSDAGHCAGPVKHVDLRTTDYWACRRHHNLIVRAWHPSVTARTTKGDSR